MRTLASSALGDFNDFEFSEPMRALTGASSGVPILTDLGTALLAPAERYSYVFEGNSQELDHIYVTQLASAWRAIPTDTHQRRVRGSGERSRSARCFAAHPASAARCRCRPESFPRDAPVTLEGRSRRVGAYVARHLGRHGLGEQVAMHPTSCDQKAGQY